MERGDMEENERKEECLVLHIDYMKSLNYPTQIKFCFNLLKLDFGVLQKSKFYTSRLDILVLKTCISQPLTMEENRNFINDTTETMMSAGNNDEKTYFEYFSSFYLFSLFITSLLCVMV